MAEALIITIYCLLIALIIVAIICGVKLIFTLNKVDALVDDVTIKVKSLDKLFEIIDFTTSKMSMISEIVISFINGGFKKLFGKSKKTKKSKKEDEIDE